MSTRSIIDQLINQGEVEVVPPGDALGQYTFRIKDKPQYNNDIGWAVLQLQNGRNVRRYGWNGKGMFLTLILGSDTHRRTVKLRAVDGIFVAWTCSQTDLLATDWELA